ncbi:MAG: hypothetical protein ACRDZY_19910, partial [Acidimicrobiales bacterium]
AVVVDDIVTGSSDLQVVDTVLNTTAARIPGGVRPSWSPDGAKLAFVAGSEVEVLDVASGTLTVVDPGIGLRAPPLWSGPSTLVLSTGATASRPGGVELVNLPVGARYSLPGVPAGSVAAAVSAAGTRLAIAGPTGTLLVAPAAGASGTAQSVGGRLNAIGFAGEGTLVAINPATNQLVRLSVGGGDTTAVTLSPGLVDLSTVGVAPDSRRLVYLAVDVSGKKQAFVANDDGSSALAITRFAPDAGVEAQAVDFAY